MTREQLFDSLQYLDDELIAVGERMEEAFVEAQIGKTETVIMEDDGTGYTGNYVRVRCEGTCGETVRVKIRSREGTTAIGTIIQEV